MNSTQPKPFLDLRLLLAIVVVLLLATLTAYRALNQSRSAADKALSDLVAVERLVDNINGSKSEVLNSTKVEFGHSGDKIAAAKAAAGISDQQNPSIADQNIREIPNSDFSVQPTRVKFVDLNMEQIIKFLLSVTQGENWMAVRSLSMGAKPNSKGRTELWCARNGQKRGQVQFSASGLSLTGPVPVFVRPTQ